MIVYRSPKGILHAVEGKTAKEIAEKCAEDGRWREVPGECRGGYPVVLGKTVVVESCGNVYVGDNDENGIPLEKCDAEMRRSVREFLIKAGV